LRLLENLDPTPRIQAQAPWKPAIVFEDGEGEATTNGYHADERPDFDRFLEEAGFDASKYEIVGEPRTSRWQVARPFPLEPEWLTAYKFRFRHKTQASVDLPLLYSQAKKKAKTYTPTITGKAFVIVAADFQIGKVASRGNTEDALARIFESFSRIEKQLKAGRYEKIVIVDAGDIVENFDNAAASAQLQSNDLSIMSQVDVASSIMFDLLKITTKYAPTVYASIGSNHCQWRSNRATIGKPGVDDWGIFITKQLRKLAIETSMPVTFLIPEPYEESLAFDLFDDGFHIVGVAHGHQSSRPEGIPSWFEKQIAGLQPTNSASILITGHFHHLRVQQLGQAPNGGSRWWIQASTSDNGSDWYRLTSGQDSTPGITCFTLEKGKHFAGSVNIF
jgi:hypothetical protein